MNLITLEAVGPRLYLGCDHTIDDTLCIAVLYCVENMTHVPPSWERWRIGTKEAGFNGARYLLNLQFRQDLVSGFNPYCIRVFNTSVCNHRKQCR